MQYEPELFPGLIYRMKVPKVVMLVFVSGKVVLTGRACARLHYPWMPLASAFGAKDYHVASDAVTRSCTQQCLPLCLHHATAACHVGHACHVHLRRAVSDGSLPICSGAKSKEDIYEAFEKIYPVLTQFRKGAQPPAALPPPMMPPATSQVHTLFCVTTSSQPSNVLPMYCTKTAQHVLNIRSSIFGVRETTVWHHYDQCLDRNA